MSCLLSTLLIAFQKNWLHFFSVPGTNAQAAEKLDEAIGADIFDIEPEVPYANADLNWMDKKARSMVEMKTRTTA